MPRKSSNQWDFGDLFSAAATRQVFSVTEVTLKIKALLEKQVGVVWVSGEITNLRLQGSGHAYFTLKDANAQLSCVLFRGTAVADRAALKDGQKVTLQGDVTVYEPRGQYQLIVRALEVQGIGALQAAFERLKQKLNAAGWFEAARKRPIPKYPHRVGIVTSPTGAALRDVIHVIGRRFAGMELLVAPSRVQGQGAEVEIAAAIRRLNAWSASAQERRLDVILVTRGGGSLEDLWAFNEEIVAQAIFESALPVVSAVGHEIDFTIADFVADLRAATPSAAAELLTAGYVESRDRVGRSGQRMRRWLEAVLDTATDAVQGLGDRLRRAHPRRRLQERMQRLDDLQVALSRRGKELVRGLRAELETLEARRGAFRPRVSLARATEQCGVARLALREAARQGVKTRREALDRLVLRLNLLSPEAVLARGYSITLDAATGTVVRQASEVVVGQALNTRLASGAVTSVVAAVARSGEGSTSPADP